MCTKTRLSLTSFFTSPISANHTFWNASFVGHKLYQSKSFYESFSFYIYFLLWKRQLRSRTFATQTHHSSFSSSFEGVWQRARRGVCSQEKYQINVANGITIVFFAGASWRYGLPPTVLQAVPFESCRVEKQAQCWRWDPSRTAIVTLKELFDNNEAMIEWYGGYFTAKCGCTAICNIQQSYAAQR